MGTLIFINAFELEMLLWEFIRGRKGLHIWASLWSSRCSEIFLCTICLRQDCKSADYRLEQHCLSKLQIASNVIKTCICPYYKFYLSKSKNVFSEAAGGLQKCSSEAWATLLFVRRSNYCLSETGWNWSETGCIAIIFVSCFLFLHMYTWILVAYFPAVFFIIFVFDICYETDKYKYIIMKFNVSWVGQPTRILV